MQSPLWQQSLTEPNTPSLSNMPSVIQLYRFVLHDCRYIPSLGSRVIPCRPKYTGSSLKPTHKRDFKTRLANLHVLHTKEGGDGSRLFVGWAGEVGGQRAWGGYYATWLCLETPCLIDRFRCMDRCRCMYVCMYTVYIHTQGVSGARGGISKPKFEGITRNMQW